MQLAQLPLAVTDLLKEYQQRFGVGEYFFYVTDTTDINATKYELHHQVALCTLYDLRAFVVKEHPRSTFKVEIDESKLTGSQIALAEFMGNTYDFTQNKILLHGDTSKYLNEYFYFDEQLENEQTAINRYDLMPTNDSGFVTSGYADAFAEPPYSFTGDRLSVGTFFNEFNQAVLGDWDTLEIFAWNIDSSNYFLAGQDWWGSFFWTVYCPQHNWYVGIVYSSTD
jgi:hypothetical protein